MTYDLRLKLVNYLKSKYKIQEYEAEDIIQDVILTLLTKNIKVQYDSMYFKCVTNACINYISRNKLIPIGDEILSLFDGTYESYMELMPNFEILPEHQRFIVEMVYNGKSIKEVSIEKNLNYHTLKTNYRLAVKKLNEYHSQQKN